MSNKFTRDIIIRTEDPHAAAAFYVEELGFKVTDENPDLVSLLGDGINFFIERGPGHGPVLEVHVPDVERARSALVKRGCKVVLDEPKFPRCYVRDPHGVVYNLKRG
jgi:catechol 2,3-dioxygenase-like lactoylglutathione lyase family enzyme